MSAYTRTLLQTYAPSGLAAPPKNPDQFLVNYALMGIFWRIVDLAGSAKMDELPALVGAYHYYLRVGLGRDPEMVAVCGRLA